MNESNVRHIAQTDPLRQLTATAGELVAELRTQLETITRGLRALDKAREALAERGIMIDVDLGPIGNAAAAARRDLERERAGATTFKLPTTTS